MNSKPPFPAYSGGDTRNGANVIATSGLHIAIHLFASPEENSESSVESAVRRFGEFIGLAVDQ